MSQPAHLPRRFALHRRYDLTGVSGTGLVAHGTQYPTGRVTLAWCCSDVQSVAVYDTIDDVELIHGHGGLTEIRWIDPPTADGDRTTPPTPPRSRRLPAGPAAPPPSTAPDRRAAVTG